APDTDAQALLMFRPTSVGPVTLEVVAYRNRLSSPPVTISVDVVGSVADLKNPNSLNPTSGIAAGPICAIKTLVSNLNLRGGPGTNYTSLARLSVAEDLTVIGRNDDSTWFQVKRDSNNMVGWVSASFTTPNDGCASAPVVTPPAAGT
ncbi:MAG TPA: SH3 domain-containing protein, partial [Aggregatilineales bacterium]|nr:SH3 domain-containing protein [Aggregatilineales bacterium]